MGPSGFVKIDQVGKLHGCDAWGLTEGKPASKRVGQNKKKQKNKEKVCFHNAKTKQINEHTGT